MATIADSSEFDPFYRLAGIKVLVSSGAPTSITAPQGSLYINTSASTASTRLYINTDGGTTWASFTASA